MQPILFSTPFFEVSTPEAVKNFETPLLTPSLIIAVIHNLVKAKSDEFAYATQSTLLFQKDVLL